MNRSLILILTPLILAGFTGCSKPAGSGPVAVIKSAGTADAASAKIAAAASGKDASAKAHLKTPKSRDGSSSSTDIDGDDDSDSSLTPDAATSTTTTPASSGSSNTSSPSAQTNLQNKPAAAASAPAAGSRSGSASVAEQLNFADDASASAKIKQAEDLLAQYPTGKTSLAEIQTRIVKLAPTSEMTKIADLSGGGYLAKEGQTPIIIANFDSSPSDIAHVLAHESQEITDHLAKREYFKAQVSFKNLVQSSLGKYKTQGLAGLQANEQTAVMFHAAGLFCSEARAFNKNLALIKEGLPFSLGTLKNLDLGNLASQSYLASHQLPPMTSIGDLGTLASQCVAQASVVSFQVAVTTPAK